MLRDTRLGIGDLRYTHTCGFMAMLLGERQRCGYNFRNKSGLID